MELEKRRPTPPPLPKRTLIPKDRPNFDGLNPSIEASQVVAPALLQNTIALVEILNESRNPPKKEEKIAAPKELVAAPILIASPRAPSLRFPWIFWTMLAIFIAAALAMFLFLPKLQNTITAKPQSPALKRDLEKIALPDPSSPTTEASESGDPFPTLKPPTKPTRN